jgi:hypothetical protein
MQANCGTVVLIFINGKDCEGEDMCEFGWNDTDDSSHQ